MTDYYFDIETVPKDPNDSNEKASLNPRTGKIATIQYQKLDSRTGTPEEELKILMEWESSEREILEKFKPLITGYAWDFIPVGYSLNFEYGFLKCKLKEYFNIEFHAEAFLERPKHDLHIIGVILNDGNFKGATLDSFTDKLHGGLYVPLWYKKQEYDKIEGYIRMEAESFLTFWQKLKKELPRLFPTKSLAQG